jgi:hypothetical protein
MSKGAATYFGLLATLRQNELLDEAAQLRRSRDQRAHRRGRGLSLSLLRRRRPR